MKKIYMDFEMNMANTKGKRICLDADIIAIGAIKYDTDTGEIEKFKSLIKPITNLNSISTYTRTYKYKPQRIYQMLLLMKLL